MDIETRKPLEPESEFIIKVQDINDNEPKFLDGPYVASVPEMSPVGELANQNFIRCNEAFSTFIFCRLM